MIYPKHIVAVSALIQNHNYKFLLVKTERRGWELPGGQVEEGEDLISGLKREVEEEAGTKIEIKKLSAVYSSISEPSKVILDFIAIYDGGNGKIKTAQEVLETQWFSFEEMISNIQNPITKYRVQWLQKNNDNIRLVSYKKNPFEVLSELVF